MAHDDDELSEADDAVPAHLPPADEERPDWLLDAAIDPMNEGQDAASLAPRITPGVPPPKPQPPPVPASRPVQPVAPPAGFERTRIPVESVDALPEPDTIGNSPHAARTSAPPPGPSPEPSGPVAWTAAASSVPVVKSRHRRAPDEMPAFEDENAETEDLPESRDDEEPAHSRSSTPRPVTIHHEPFWLIALDELRTNRKIQIGVAVAAVILVVIVNAPWKDRGLRLSKVLANAATLDGQGVRVSGKVGEVFQLGGGWAFYLHDGKDSIVVFTRTSRPLKKARIQVFGTVSTGVLDGAPRAAIFEAPDPKSSS